MEIISDITASIDLIRDSELFKDWLNRIKTSPGDLIVFNNSFIYREQGTTKSDYFIALVIGSDKKIVDIKIAKDILFNSDFKHYAKSKHDTFPNLIPMNIAIDEQLKNIGKIIFTVNLFGKR